ncbi:MAG TPA: hypothetical protein VLN45_09290 [Ignavibacteriaceae bacterium]|nr:hypothetical protein [Ignavibacteriaceae bacterium]
MKKESKVLKTKKKDVFFEKFLTKRFKELERDEKEFRDEVLKDNNLEINPQYKVFLNSH